MKYILFMLDKGPEYLEKIFLEVSHKPVELEFVYGCKSVEDCDAAAELEHEHLFLIYDNKWLDGKPYPLFKNHGNLQDI